MTASASQTFVGFGFGAIQAGLFLLEAQRSGNFGRLVVAEVVPEVVRAVRASGGVFRVSIAHPDRVETVPVGPVEIEDPAVADDRARLLEAIGEASEIATAVPSVRFYANDSPGSIHRVLAAGLARRFGAAAGRRGRPVAIYAAENHNRAAEILEEAVLAEVPAGDREAVRRGARFLNTVIGKMSGSVSGAGAAAIPPFCPGQSRSFLVEEFHRIQITRIDFGADAGFRRGIEVFEEKADLLPFEEAKLYGHNASHALAAYLAAELGLVRMDALRRRPDAIAFVRAAFLEESGGALVRKWKGVDRLFTPEGFGAYVDDLLDRMTNPWLGDLVERVARDPARKLGWDDRLVGTVRLALAHGIAPRRYALGTALALGAHDPAAVSTDEEASAALTRVWAPASPAPEEQERVLPLVLEGLAALRSWRRTGRAPF